MKNTSSLPHFAIPLVDIRAGPGAPCVDVQYKPIVPSNTTLFYTMPHTTHTRIFALNPTHKGFGYAVLELPSRLVDWGLAGIKGDKHSGAVAWFEKLLDRFRPDAVVFEDAKAPGSRRRPRVRELIDALVKL